MSFRQLLIRRLRALIPVLLGVMLVTFALVHLTPGDPARSLLTQKVTPEVLAQVRHQLGEDKSLLNQLVTYVGNAAQGDLGYSYRLNESVNAIVSARLPVTLLLIVYACVLAILMGVPLAIVSATRA